MFPVLRRRILTTFCVVMSLLFSQLALASYICQPPLQAGMAMDTMASGEPCESMLSMDAQLDEQQPGLCLQHCAEAPLSFEPVQPPAVSLPAVIQALRVPAVAEAASDGASHAAETGRTRPPPDPVFLSTLRLRV